MLSLREDNVRRKDGIIMTLKEKNKLITKQIRVKIVRRSLADKLDDSTIQSEIVARVNQPETHFGL